jgi:hypothetical protein
MKLRIVAKRMGVNRAIEWGSEEILGIEKGDRELLGHLADISSLVCLACLFVFGLKR